MAKSELIRAIEQICDEKGIEKNSVIETIEAALAVAFRKDFGDKIQNIQVIFDPETGASQIFDVKEVVEDALFKVWEKEREEAEALKEAIENGEIDPEELKKQREEERAQEEAARAEREKKGEDAEEEEEEPKYDPRKNVSKTAAQKLKKGAKIGDEIKTELFPPEEYGRMAAQTAKQVIIQKLREAERQTVFENFQGKEGEVFTGTVQRMEGRSVLIDIGKATAIITPDQQVPRERYNTGERVKVVLMSIENTTKGPEIIASRTHADMVKYLFELEVPEIASGVIEVVSVAREAGSRSKIAVKTEDESIDPVGSCVGQRGARVQTVISELGGEKIDIIEYNEDIKRFIIQALAPAKIVNVEIDEEKKTAKAEVEEDQLSLAIGKGGQNVRLSSELTGYRIDIVEVGGTSEDKDKEEVAEETKEVKEVIEEVEDVKVEEEKSEPETEVSEKEDKEKK